MKSEISTAMIALVCAAVLAGCNPISNVHRRERVTQLETVTNTYRKLMRWGHYDQAAQYLKARDGSQQRPDFAAMSRYKVTQFSYGEQLVADTQIDARVTAYIEFYNTDSGAASGVTDIQYWWYDEDAKRWYLGSPMVNFAARE